jgi:hypothetical protein
MKSINVLNNYELVKGNDGELYLVEIAYHHIEDPLSDLWQTIIGDNKPIIYKRPKYLANAIRLYRNRRHEFLIEGIISEEEYLKDANRKDFPVFTHMDFETLNQVIVEEITEEVHMTFGKEAAEQQREILSNIEED